MLAGIFKAVATQSVRNKLRPIVYYSQRVFISIKSRLGYTGTPPSFLVIGTQKGGTTTFYDALCAHPMVVQARTKEISFFDRHFDWGKRWYFANFPRLNDTGQVTGEATPDYMFMPGVAERVAEVLGQNVKFIVLLRDPVSRAISHYFHEARMGSERLSIEAAFAAESYRLSHSPDSAIGPRLERLTPRFCYSYRARGRYAEQLEPWFRNFGREAFYVQSSEAFYADPAGIRDEALVFLGLKPKDLPEIKLRNPGIYRSEVPNQLLEALRHEFLDEISNIDLLTNGSALNGA